MNFSIISTDKETITYNSVVTFDFSASNNTYPDLRIVIGDNTDSISLDTLLSQIKSLTIEDKIVLADLDGTELFCGNNYLFHNIIVDTFTEDELDNSNSYKNRFFINFKLQHQVSYEGKEDEE